MATLHPGVRIAAVWVLASLGALVLAAAGCAQTERSVREAPPVAAFPHPDQELRAWLSKLVFVANGPPRRHLTLDEWLKEGRAIPRVRARLWDFLLFERDRPETAQALVAITHYDRRPRLSVIIPLLDHPYERTRTQAAVALGESRDRRALVPLLEAVERPGDDNDNLRANAYHAIAKLDGWDTWAVWDKEGRVLETRHRTDGVEATLARLALRRDEEPDWWLRGIAGEAIEEISSRTGRHP
jgi:YD repeat-containing protein